MSAVSKAGCSRVSRRARDQLRVSFESARGGQRKAYKSESHGEGC